MILDSNHLQPGSTNRPSEIRQPGSVGGLVSWIVLVAIAASALALAAAHLPPIFKKLGLFAVAYGLIVGLIAAWLQQFTPGLVMRRRLATVCVVLLAAAGQVGLATESFRIERAKQSAREKLDPKQLLARQLVESTSEPPAGMSEETVEEMRRTLGGPGVSFGDYLRFRVSGIGIHSKQAAGCFWGMELLLGGAAAGWVFRRRTGGIRPPDGPSSAELDAAGAPAKLEQ